MNMQRFSATTMEGDKLSVEYVVIGSGAGGALTASYLAEKGKDVLILEEGPHVRPSEETCGIADSFSSMWREGGAIPIVSNTSLVFGEGRGLGGTTMINAGLIRRIPHEVLEDWKRDYDVREVEPLALEQYHEKIEKALDVRPGDDSTNRAGELLKKGADTCGYKGVLVPVAGNFQGGKHTMQKTYLRRAVEHGARVMTDCRAEKIVFKGGRAAALRVRYEGRLRTVYFNSLFICAGTIQSALLLRRSGITKNIGNTVQFHPTFRVIAEFEEPINAFSSGMSSFQVTEFSPLLTMGASITSPAFIASGLSLNWQENKTALPRMDRMAIYYLGVKSKARGRARNMPFFRNSYAVFYKLLEDDLKNIAGGYKKLAKMLFSVGAVRLYPALRGVPSTAREAADIPEDMFSFDRLSLVTIHSYSSCPMGEERDSAAVDSYGKLHGYENVYVHDASILPTSPGVNPQGPLMAMVLRCLERNFG